MNMEAHLVTQMFNSHWTIILWVISFIFMILLFTRLWKYIWAIALIYDGIGWLCIWYAGITGNWFIGWFAWVVTLSATLFIRGMIEHLMNLPYKPDGDNEKRL